MTITIDAAFDHTYCHQDGPIETYSANRCAKIAAVVGCPVGVRTNPFDNSDDFVLITDDWDLLNEAKAALPLMFGWIDEWSIRIGKAKRVVSGKQGPLSLGYDHRLGAPLELID